jgi:hypothetical protein
MCSAPSATATPTSSSTISAPVTSRTTGIAGFTCDNQTLTDSSAGIAYTQDCGVYYPTNRYMVAPDPKAWVKNLPLDANNKSIDPVARYTFKGCIDRCDEYNSGGGSPACYGVSYYANLTYVSSVRHWKGNCFMKNGRGEGISEGTGDEDWEHTASAYKSCLSGDNSCPSHD